MAKKANICQYWIEDEPVQCANWDEEGQICIFEPAPDEAGATHAPNCNMIGTAITCNHYEGAGIKATCILPDPSRHVCNRKTSEKWIVEQISGYNDGKCDGAGTDTTCSGYSPYHMAFSKLLPTRDESIDSAGLSTIDEIGYRLPLNFAIYNARAKLSRCRWWAGESLDFSINSETGKIDPIEFKCTCPDEMTNEFSDFKLDTELGMNRAPCNGAKLECPGYTGICWQYCIDEKTRTGDKVLAEQILELRYYLRQENWTGYTFDQSFGEPSIKAWAGNIYTEFDENQVAINWIIDAIRTYIPGFEKFAIEYEKVPLTAGTEATGFVGDYPSLVGKIKDLPLMPLIRNKFDQDESGANIFEVTKLQHKYILIVGDVFYYNSKVYGINLNDPDLGFLPTELREYDNMDEIRVAYTKEPERFEEFYNELDYILDWLIKYSPDKLEHSLSAAGENSFYINMPTFFGDNEIVVFDKGSSTWEYSKICLRKILCNGIIGQTGFSVESEDNMTVSYLPSYESDFMSYVNKNGLITFKFFPFLSEDGGASVDYVYNDSIRKRLDVNPAYPAEFDTYEMCYELFKVKIFDRIQLELENFRILGNAGNVLVIIPDEAKQLTNVIKLWEIDGDITLSVTGPNDQAREIAMEIDNREENTDRLEINQILIKPKDINQWSQICDAKLNIGPIYIYEKRSFGEEPDTTEYEEVRESFLGADDVVDYRDVVELKKDSGNIYSLTNFGSEPLMMSVVFKGITGRMRGQTKTKMITWVRQPYCRDVEINYSWAKQYQKCVLQPEKSCYGTPSLKCEAGGIMMGFTPSCGDHDLSIMSGKGPMWYPYEECDSYARYNITGNLTEWDISIMEPFYEVDGSGLLSHGSWDMRMLGPVDQDGRTCDVHAQLWDCTCDWSFCNYYKKSENLFTGWGRYRGGIIGADKFNLIANNGSLPKFGNVYRDFLRSFRSIDNIDYYYSDGSMYTRKRKWVPVSEFYGVADVTSDTNEFPYHLYSSNDYYDDSGSFVHPLSLMTIHSDIENIMIDEKIDIDNEGNPKRYRFEEVFEALHTLSTLYYPYPKHPSFKLVGGQLKPIISWYRYRDYPGEGGGGDTSIQWAWQEIWKEIERYVFSLGDISCGVVEIGPVLSNCLVRGPYKFISDGDNINECVGSVEGKHVFLDVQYTNYKYDAFLGEHRLICGEGKHIITFIPPDFEEYDDGIINTFCWVKLDEGPPRAFDKNGNWDPLGSEKVNPLSTELYKHCTASPWSSDITLFAEGYDNPSEAAAKADDRIVVTYDSAGEEVKEYYQRGLNITILPDSFNDVPGLVTIENRWDVLFNDKPDCMGDNSSDWINVELGEWYEAPPCLDVTYCCGDVDSGDSIEFEYCYTGEKSHRVLCMVLCQFKFGAEELQEEEPPLSESTWFGNLFHMPGVEILTSRDGEDYERVYNSDTMTLTTKNNAVESKTGVYEWNICFDDFLGELKKYVKIKFRTSPTGAEINAISGLNDYYTSSTNMVHIECIHMYFVELSEATEDVYTYERLYNISYGNHGDFPPHGYNNTGSCLYPLVSEGSTVYQYDSLNGVVGMPNSDRDCETMNKCRGRLLYKCYADKEPLDIGVGGGISWLYKAEEEQKKIHDAIALAGKTTFKMESVCPPGLEEHLRKAGVGFPSWTCYFVNTLILSLSPVVLRASYSAPGHYFDWDFENMERKVCGRLFSRFYADVFTYVYRKASGEAMWDSMDAIEAYIRGVGSLLVSPMDYLAADMARADQLQETIKAVNTEKALFEIKEGQRPPAVDPLY